MTERIFPTLYVLLAILTLVAATAAPAAVTPDQFNQGSLPDYVSDRIIVGLEPASVDGPPDQMSEAAPAIAALNAAHAVTSVQRAFPDLVPAPQPESEISAYLDNTYILTLPAGQDPVAVAAEYAAQPGVRYAEPDYIRYAMRTDPNDPYWTTSNSWGQGYRDQWDMEKISCPVAWDIQKGSASVVIAVVDTGVDYNHADIAANMWRNPGETINGIDDDGNGKIDDYYGYDFVNSDSDPMDDRGHGTHCAGTIGAVSNNGLGMAGINWNCSVMAVKGLSAGGSGSDTGLASCILYAANEGADVISMSWGGSGFSQTIHDALLYAHDVKNCVLVVAAGNSSANIASYNPAGDNYAITVSASDQNDAACSFTNWGVKTAVAAPGGGPVLPTPTYAEYNCLSLRAGTTVMVSTDCIVGTYYCRLAGTSMACPHVSGLAGLVLAQHPTWNTEQVRQAIQMNSDDILTAGFDRYGGFGRINAYKAVSALDPMTALITSPSNSATVSGSVTVTGTAAGPNFAGYTVDCGSGYEPTAWIPVYTGASAVTNGTLATWDSASLAGGTYTLRLRTTGTGAVTNAEYRLQVTVVSPCGSGHYTELFMLPSTFDLDNTSLLFVPDGSPSFYSEYRQPIAALPVDPAGGTPLTLSDNSYAQVTLTGGAQVSLYGSAAGTFYVGSNGYITFGSGDASSAESSGAHFAFRRISALYRNLVPAAGSVTWKQLSDQAVVTFQNVPEYGTSNQNTFQIQMFFDGRIALSYLDVAASYGLVGLSQGSGIPANYTPSNLSACGTAIPISRYLLLTKPNGGEFYEPGQTVPVKWSYLGSQWLVTDRIRLESSADSGVTWTAIAGAASLPYDARAFDWDTTGITESTHYRVRVVYTSDTSIGDQSNADFSFATDTTAPVITHTPLADTGNLTGPYPVTATITDALGVGVPTLFYSKNGGGFAAVAMSPASNPNEFTASIAGPSSAGDTYHYYVVATDLARTPNTARSPATGEYSFAVTNSTQVLSYIQYADTATTGEYQNTLSAIRATCSIENTEMTNYSQLSSLIVGKNVLLIPEQESGSSSTMQTVGTAWKPILQDFLSRGGRIVVCDFSGASYQILNSAGLMSISSAASATNQSVQVIDPTNPLMAGMVSPYVAMDGSNSYTTTETCAVVRTTSGLPVVLAKPVGLGLAVMIGHDYWSSNDSMKRLIANAVGGATSRILFLSSPNGGESYEPGTSVAVRWAAAGTPWVSGDTVRLEYSRDGGGAWNRMPGAANLRYELGVFQWDTTGLPESSQYRVRVVFNDDRDRSILDTSDANFSIATDTTPPVIVHTPLDNTSNLAGPYSVKATVTDVFGVSAVTLFYSKNGGAFSSIPMTSTGTPNEYGAAIPGPSAYDDVYHYYITAADNARTPNTSRAPASGDYTFDIIREIELLSYIGYADTAATGEYQNTLKAIRLTQSIHNTEFTDYTQLSSAIAGKAVLLVPEQELSNLTQMQTIGAAWAPVLQSFLAGGGRIVVCDCTGGSYAILTGAGLMSITNYAAITNQSVQVVNPDHPITKGIVSPYTALSGSNSYTTTEPGALVTTVGGAPVVLLKAVSTGSVILVGHDYYSSNASMDRLIGNAVGAELGRILLLNRPNGGEYYEPESAVTINWTAGGPNWTESDTVRLYCSADSGSTWNPIPGASALPYNAGSFSWDTTGLAPSTTYRVRVGWPPDVAVTDSSNSNFSFAWDTMAPAITHTALPPTADKAGPYNVRATVIDAFAVGTVTLYYSKNGGPFVSQVMSPSEVPNEYVAGIPGPSLYGDVYEYYVTATDIARSPNTSRAPSSGSYTFQITPILIDTVGRAGITYSGSRYTSGNVFSCTTTSCLTQIEAYLNITTSTELRFLVYESASLTGTYMKIHETTIPSSGIGTGWYGSGPIAVRLVAGKCYLMAAAWQGSAYCYYTSVGHPTTVAFGTSRYGYLNSTYPPLNSVTHSSSSYVYYQRYTTNVAGRSLNVVRPNGGEFYEPGQSIGIRWDSYGGEWQPSDTIKLEYTLDSGANWNAVPGASVLPYDVGSFAWNTTGLPDSTACKVRVGYNGDSGVTDASDAAFGILPDTTPPVITHAPIPDNADTAGPYTVRATVKDAYGVGAVALFCRKNGGSYVEVAMSATGAADEYSADIPSPSAIGDVYEYYITSVDSAHTPNTSRSPSSGSYTFKIVPGVVDTLGSPASSGTSTAYARGSAFSCSLSSTLGKIEYYLNILTSSELRFFVYQASSLSGTYTKIHETRIADPGTGPRWYGSGPISVPLYAGTYYIIGAAWQGNVTYYYTSGVYPVNTIFGRIEGGYAYSGFPPPSTTSYSGTSYIPYQRLTTIIPGRRLTITAPNGGGFYEPGTALPVQWSYLGTGWTGSDTVRLDFSSDNGSTWTGVPGAGDLPYASGSFIWDTTGIPGSSAYRVRVASNEDPTVADASDGAFTVMTDTTPPAITHTPFGDTGDKTGPYVITATVTDSYGVSAVALSYSKNSGASIDLPMTPTGTPNQFAASIPGPSVLGDVYAYHISAVDGAVAHNVSRAPSIGEHVFAIIPAVTDTIGLPNTYTSGSATLRGNIFSCTTPAILTKIEHYLNISSSTQLRFFVYESPSSNGTYTKIHETTVPSSGTGAGWYSSGNIAVTLVAGRYYIIGTAWQTSCSYYYGGTHPVTTTFGRSINGFGYTGFPPPAIVTNSGSGTVYYQRITSLATGRALTVTKPNGGEFYEPGQNVPVIWTAAGPDWVSSDRVKLEYSSDNGISWNPVAGGTDLPYNAGSFVWNVDAGAVPSSQYRVRVVFNSDSSVADASDGVFTVQTDTAPPVINHTPVEDSNNLAGPYPVTAIVTDSYGVAAVNLYYSKNGGEVTSVAMTPVGGPNQFTANIPGPSTMWDVYTYYITASDAALTPNTSRAPATGEYSFRIQPLTTDIIGAPGSYSSTAALCRGNIFACTTSMTLTRIEHYLSPTASTELRFFVYESTSSSGTFTKIHENTVANSGVGLAWYSSGPLSVMLTAGKYYIIGTGWQGTARYYYGGSHPVTTAFGRSLNGYDYGGYPPPATAANTFSSAVYYQRLTTLAGRTMALDRPNGGEYYEPGQTVSVEWTPSGATWLPTDTVKLEYSSDDGSTWVPVPGAAAVAYNAGSYNWDTTGLAASTAYRVRVTFNDDPAVTDGSDAVFTIMTDTTPPVILHNPLPDAASSGPYVVIASATDVSGVSSITLSYSKNGETATTVDMTATGTPDQYSAPIPGPGVNGDTFTYHITATDAALTPNACRAPEAGEYTFHINSGVIDTIGIPNYTSLLTGYSRGNVFACTLNSTLVQIETYLGITSPTALKFYVYQSDIPDGTFTKIHETTVPSSGTGINWYSSGTIGVQLLAGRYYIIGSAWSGTATCYYGGSHPVSVAFGRSLAGFSNAGYPPPGNAYNSGSTTVYHQRLASIPAPRGLVVTKPNGGESYEPGATVNIQWTAHGAYWQPTDKVRLEHSDDYGGTWKPIDGAAALPYNSGTYAWTTAAGMVQGQRYRVRVSYNDDPSVRDTSDSNFTLATDLTAPVITHTALTDTRDTVGPYNVSATVTDVYGIASVKLYYSRNGSAYTSLDMALTGTPNRYAASIPGPSYFGDVYSYYITATDTARAPNITRTPATGAYSFTVRSTWTDVLGNGSYSVSGTGFARGNVFSCTQDAILTQIEANMTIPESSFLSFAVYESTTQTGSYTKVMEVNKTGSVATEAWYSSGPIYVRLISGRYYVVATACEGYGIAYYNSYGHPVTVAFGKSLSGYAYAGFPLPLSTTYTSSNYVFYQRLTTDLGTRSLTITAPNGGEIYEPGRTVNITWSVPGIGWVPGDTVKLEYSSNGGTVWTTIPGAEALPYNAGSFAWDTTALPSSTQYRVRVAYNGGQPVNDMSDANFTIQTDAAGPIIAHVPLPSTTDLSGPYVVKAQVTDVSGVASVVLTYSKNGETASEVTMAPSGAPNEYVASIPGPSVLGDTYAYRITAVDEAFSHNIARSPAAGDYTFKTVLTQIDTVGGTTTPQSTRLSLRGNVYSCTQTSALSRIEHYLEPAGPCDLWFFVYEAGTSAGTYTRKYYCLQPYTGSGPGWYSSPAISVTLTAGKYYIIGAAWQGDAISYYEATGHPVCVAFGHSLAGFASSYYPPPATITAGSSPRVYYQRLTTTLVGRTLLVTRPNGGESWDMGKVVPLEWGAAGTQWASGDKVHFDCSADSGTTWTPIAGAENLPYNAGPFDWDTSGLSASDHYRIRIVFNSDTSIADESDADFAIAGIPPQAPVDLAPADGTTVAPAGVRLAWRMPAADLITDGGFETGNLGGWRRYSTGSGGFIANNGTFDPPGPGTPLAPLDGAYCAMSQQTTLTSMHRLFQDVKIPAGAVSATLRWNHKILNYATYYQEPNQQFRVQLCDTSDAVLAGLFSTQPGDPLLIDWTDRSADLTSYAGQVVRVSFTEQSSLGYQNAYLDNVSLLTDPGTPAGVVYDVYLGTGPTLGPADLLGSTSSLVWDLPSLDPGKTYYWQIVARSAFGHAGGPVWSFTTSGATMTASSIAELKTMADSGSPVRLTKAVVTYAPRNAVDARTTPYFYIGDTAGLGCVRVVDVRADDLRIGNAVEGLIGRVHKDAETGEYLFSLAADPAAQASAADLGLRSIKPLGLNCAAALRDAIVLTNAVTICGRLSTAAADKASLAVSDGPGCDVSVIVNGVPIPENLGIDGSVMVSGVLSKDASGARVLYAQEITTDSR